MIRQTFYKLRYRRSTPAVRPKLAAEHVGVSVGSDCLFFGAVSFGSEPYLVSLGDRVMLSDNVQFVTHDGGIRVLDNMGIYPKGDAFAPIRVGSNVFIGAGTRILKGVTIGDNVVIGAGSIVTGDVDSNSVWAGVPARRIKSIQEYADGLRGQVVTAYGMAPDEKKSLLLKRFESR